MSAAQIIEDLTQLGVELWADAGQLRFRAPASVLTEAHKDALRTHKAEILSLLDRERDVTVVADPAARHEPFPLTDVQAAYLIGRQESFGYGGVACHGYLEMTWPDLPADVLERAWNLLIHRHDMLRAVIERDGYQHVLPQVPLLRIASTDLREAGPSVVAAHMESVREAMDHRVYDTTTWPLFELRHTRTPDGDVVHFSLDSLIADWASAGILFDELDVILAGHEAELAPLDIGFRDYLLAEHRLRDTARYRNDRRYWSERVDSLPAAPQLSLAASATQAPARFVRHHLHLPAGAWAAFRAHAVNHGVTPTAGLLTAYARVIARWSRQPHFTLNLTLLNRLPLHPQTDRLVGDFTSVSLLEVRPPTEEGFAAQARAVATQLFEDMDHRLFSGVETVREIARRRGREAALMPVVFTGAIGLHATTAPASGRRPGHGITQTPQVLLDCQAGDGPDGLRVSWDVREQAFPAGMVEDMFEAFSVLVARLADDASAWTAALEIALPTWQREERDTVNATAVQRRHHLLHDDILVQASRRPDKVAVTDAHGSLTFGQLAGRAHGLARQLREHGLTSGEPVAVAMEKSCGQIIAVLGVLLAGGAYVPVDPAQPRLRRERIVGQAGIRLAIAHAPDATVDWPESLDWLFVKDAAESAAVKPSLVAPDTLAYVIFTSGSTGEPKGVMISHAAARNTIDDIDRRFGVGENDRVLGLAQLGFDLSVYDIFGVLGRGGTLVLPDPARGADPSHWAERVENAGVTLWNSVPAQMQMLADFLDSDPRALPTLRLALLSGDWIALNLPLQLRRHIPDITLIGLGGATEASIWSNYHRIDHVDPRWTSIPYGVPLANQWFRVLDARMRDVPTWVPGDLYIGGDGLAMGYLGDEALTASRFLVHPHDGTRLYRTGDLARYLPGGELEFLGREDGQVKLRGHRIELGEIESALWSHPDVSAAAVVMSEGDGGERTLLGFVEAARCTVDATEDVPGLSGVLRHAERAGFSVAHGDYVRAVHDAARESMLHALSQREAWPVDEAVDADTLLKRTRIHERHRWLVRLWLDDLRAAGWLHADTQERLRPTRPVDAVSVTTAWHHAASQAADAGTPLAVIDYLRVHAARLDALLDDACNPFELLFPQGGNDLALALYGEEPASRYNNHALAALLRQIAARRESGQPLRVLEIGAGTGATTNVIAPLLDGLDADYLFTDLGSFFLPESRQRFAVYPWLRHSLFDVDRDHREQGLAPGSFDVVICAGVLGSVRDPDAALTRIGELLSSDGWLLFTEPTQDHPHILLSQGFMMSPAGGDRDRGRSPFLSAPGWQDAIRRNGGEPVLVLPGEDHALAPGGMRFFAARYKRDRRPLAAASLNRHLGERLPAHMVPGQLQVVDRLPLTANGKIDRKTLAAWRIRTITSEGADTAVEADPLERRLCAIWAEALGVPSLRRDDNVYDHGADSLILARVAGRVREEVPGADVHAYDTILRQMLNEPNVAALARLLRGDEAHDGTPTTTTTTSSGTREGSNALLVPFGGGEGVTRVMFHAALGTLDYFQHLGKSLAAQQQGPVIGVAVADTERYLAIEPRRLIETVADDYAERLLAEGHTRFQLVGYCLGGLLATEVARRLLARGVDVVDLSLVDSIPMFIDTDEELAFEAIFVPNLNLDPVKAVFGPGVEDMDVYRAIDRLMHEHDRKVPAGAMAALSGDAGLDAVAKAARLRAAIPQDERLAAYAAAASAQAGLPVSPELVPALFRVCRHSMRAARFDPPPYVGDMTYLRCEEQQSFGVTGGVGHLAAPFWENTCLGDFRLIDVPGNHFSVIEPPHVAIVTEHLLNALRSKA
ncbi:amino acid adenylation domain-containing protein [Luteibacter anthropi]|uniref:non-ribosomal peptide synthetase n=1 Tax=Luteibacter anthropi TaxID=564369 RepID=UPI002032833A|nr:non-ribosomal peptide synthetase [Luteibacter anthropi]URX61839.1 amino acid adenylation domain-containing protein [Luteibacter anthropi]